MTLAVFTGTAHTVLGGAVAARLGLPLGACEIQAFPDSELHIEIGESVRGRDVYIIQPISPPTIERHLIELLLLADATRRGGAARITAVVPYLGYARQDRRLTGGEASAARVVAGLVDTGGFTRLVALDLHSAALEGFFSTPVDHLSAVPVLTQAVAARLPANPVIVAPDLGAAKLAERYAKALDLPVAIVHKERRSGTDVEVRRITGDVRRRTPIIVDDMISTAGTVAAAGAALVAASAEPELIVVATHALLLGPAVERLRGLRLRRLIVTDSVARSTEATLPIEVASVAALLADAVSRLHEDRSIDELLARE